MPAKTTSNESKTIEEMLEEDNFTEEEFFSTKKARGAQQRLSFAAYSVIKTNKKIGKMSISDFISNAIIEYGLKTLPHNKLNRRILDKNSHVNQNYNLELSLDGIKRLLIFILSDAVFSNVKKYNTFSRMSEYYNSNYEKLSELSIDMQIKMCIKNFDKTFKNKLIESLWYAVIFAQQLGIELPPPPSKE